MTNAHIASAKAIGESVRNWWTALDRDWKAVVLGGGILFAVRFF